MNKSIQTRGNTQETDCQSKYQTNPVMWDDDSRENGCAPLTFCQEWGSRVFFNTSTIISQVSRASVTGQTRLPVHNLKGSCTAPSNCGEPVDRETELLTRLTVRAKEYDLGYSKNAPTSRLQSAAHCSQNGCSKFTD